MDCARKILPAYGTAGHRWQAAINKNRTRVGLSALSEGERSACPGGKIHAHFFAFQFHVDIIK